MMDLPDFLLARIAEDEAMARAATPGGWRPEREHGHYSDEPGYQSTAWAVTSGDVAVVAVQYDRDYSLPDGGCERQEDAEHIARWDPAHVLAECGAKRQIVEDLQQELANQHDPEPTTLQLAERTLLALTLPYLNHPDCREEWKP